MKIKITCRPRYNPWLKKYLNTKTFSKMLALGVLINSAPINSFAGILSDDGRYEAFEGSDITINNILEEDKVDVEIEGNTLVNLTNANTYSLEISQFSTINNIAINTSNRYLKATTNGDLANGESSWMYVNLGKPNLNMLKPNTTYTVIGDIIKGIYSIAIINGNSSNPLTAFNRVNNNTALLTTTDFDTNSISNQIIYGYIDNYTSKPIDIEVKDIILIEGDWTNRDIPKYFEGMKSVGQDDENGHNTEISSFNNGNLINDTTFTNGYYVRRTDGKITENSDFSYTDYIEVLSNKVIHVYNTNLNYAFYDENKNFIGMIRPIKGEGYLAGGDGSFSTLIPSNARYVRFSVPIKNQSVAKASYIKNGVLNKAVLFDRKNVLLNEPLRGLPNGVKDRIIKRNGQWYIERKIGKTTLGSDRFAIDIILDKYQNDETIAFKILLNDRKISPTQQENNALLSDKFLARAYSEMLYSNKLEGFFSDSGYTSVYCRFKKERLSGYDININGIRDYLTDNPIELLYELKNPVYEPIKSDLSVNLFEDTTHISTNSTIPANLKVTVDRTMNRATEAVELAKTNPTVENISLARMWTNLLKESIKKDELQSELNNNIDIVDLQLERKTASSNVDVYIKSENMLSMNLSTNSITFDDFSGVEDMIKENAVNISINSSLPYNLNAYLATDIQNSDKSNAMNKDILSIKDNSEVDYQTFTNTIDKVVLKSNCDSGNDKQHNVDLKLNGGVAHEKDVYKVTIKFEAEQQ